MIGHRLKNGMAASLEKSYINVVKCASADMKADWKQLAGFWLEEPQLEVTVILFFWLLYSCNQIW